MESGAPGSTALVTLSRLQRTLNYVLWPVRLVALLIVLGAHGPVRWVAGAILLSSMVVDGLVWWRARSRAEPPPAL
jgi:hypothetical protein